MKLLSAGDRDVTAVQFAPDGRALLAYCDNGVPLLWDVPLGDEPRPVTTGPLWARAFTFSPDANVIGWLSNGVRLEFDRRTETVRKCEWTPRGEGLLAQVVCGPEGRLVFSTVHERDGPRLRAFTPTDTGATEVWSINFTSGLFAAEIAAIGADKVFVYEAPPAHKPGERQWVLRSAATGEVLDSARAPGTYIRVPNAARDGSAVAGFNRAALVGWRPGELVEKVRIIVSGHFRAVTFHPDGRHLLTGNNDGAARLIDTRSWETIRQYDWRIGKVSAVAISPDGALAAAGGERGRVVVWDLDV